MSERENRPTSSDLRQLKRDNLKWPEALAEIPRAEWPPNVVGVQPSGTFALKVFRSRKFIVVVWDQSGVSRLSVNRTDFSRQTKHAHDRITWDDLQRLKREAGYGDWCAVELFPPDDMVVNVANMRHLFIVPSPGFMWRQ